MKRREYIYNFPLEIRITHLTLSKVNQENINKQQLWHLRTDFTKQRSGKFSCACAPPGNQEQHLRTAKCAHDDHDALNSGPVNNNNEPRNETPYVLQQHTFLVLLGWSNFPALKVSIKSVFLGMFELKIKQFRMWTWNEHDGFSMGFRYLFHGKNWKMCAKLRNKSHELTLSIYWRSVKLTERITNLYIYIYYNI